MRRKITLLLLSLAVGAGACSDDDGPSFPPNPFVYEIIPEQPSVTVIQDSSLQLELLVLRDETVRLKWPTTATITVTADGFPPETTHVERGGQVTWSNHSGVLHGVDFRNFPNNGGNNPSFPDISPWTNGDTTRTMPNVQRDSLYIFRCNVSGHTADSGFIQVHSRPALTYTSADYDIANVSSTGLVTGIAGGSTTITVSGSGTSIDIPVTVVARPVTDIELTFLDPFNLSSRLTEDTIYAFPGDAASTQLRAVVMSGNDTVFCNRCANFASRPQRYVNFISRDSTKLLARNTANPRLRPDTAGRLLALDTTSGNQGVYVVLETVDNVRDSVLVHIKLRPIDSLEVRLDSFIDPLDPDDLDPYPSTAIRVDSVVKLGVTFRSKVQDPPDPNTGILPAPRFIQVTNTGTLRRAVLPIVLWESAQPSYASITQAGFVTGLRWFTDAANRVLTCASTGTVIPGEQFPGPRLRPSPPAPMPATRSDSLAALYVIPGCPTTTAPIPMPGVLCTGWQPGGNNPTPLADPNSICTVWIRATAIDQATGNELEDEIAITVRRP